MFFKQYYLACLSHASYLIGDESTGRALVVDPQRDVDHYLADARAHDLRIEHVFLTHFHADFLAGHLELAQRCGAKIHLGAAAQTDFPVEKHRDGDIVSLGRVELRILETPGHTPEGISIVVRDTAQPDAPAAVLTGDTLFVGDVGRPDLMASIGISAHELAALLYDSLHGKLLTLPDETLVYPAHGAGSLCGKALGSETFTTIGHQRRFNYALAPMTKSEFVALVTADQPAAPKYFLHDAMRNRQNHDVLDAVLERGATALSVDRVVAGSKDRDWQVVDVRAAADFAAGHLRGSINVGLDGKFANWAGTVLDLKQPIVVLADVGKEAEAVLRLGRVGLDQIVGYVAGGFPRVRESAAPISRWDRETPESLAQRLRSGKAPVLLDVRTPTEHASGHLEGSLSIPLLELGDRLESIPEGPVVTICRSGYRSAIASSLLERVGREVSDLDGGMLAWGEARMPVVGAVAATSAVPSEGASCPKR